VHGVRGCASVVRRPMTYAYPRVADLGMRIKTLLAVIGEPAASGRAVAAQYDRRSPTRHQDGRHGKGLPARVIPFEVFHIASLGIDLLLGAIAYVRRRSSYSVQAAKHRISRFAQRR